MPKSNGNNMKKNKAKLLKCKQPPFICIGKKCPKYPPKEHFDNRGSMTDGCKDYPGYGYCYNKKYGKPVDRQIYYVDVETGLHA